MERKQKVSVLITDLDNTLYDWVDHWHQAFAPVFEAARLEHGIEPERFFTEIRAVFKQHGTDEYAFFWEEMPCLREAAGGQAVLSAFDDLIALHRDRRHSGLKPYSGVIKTLETLQAKGTMIIGYTESMACYALPRLRLTGLDRFLTRLYARRSHAVPGGLDAVHVKAYGFEHCHQPAVPSVLTPHDRLKPDPAILRDIVEWTGQPAERIVYLGDNLHKDIEMARAAGILDIHAAYGAVSLDNRFQLDLLNQMSRFDAMAKQPKDDDVQPSHSLETGFAQLLEHLVFTDASHNVEKTSAIKTSSFVEGRASSAERDLLQ
jgi:FMN phosphatase YigB (HAD superfamily)